MSNDNGRLKQVIGLFSCDTCGHDIKMNMTGWDNIAVGNTYYLPVNACKRCHPAFTLKILPGVQPDRSEFAEVTVPWATVKKITECQHRWPRHPIVLDKQPDFALYPRCEICGVGLENVEAVTKMWVKAVLDEKLKEV
jgi:ribosomal protein L31